MFKNLSYTLLLTALLVTSCGKENIVEETTPSQKEGTNAIHIDGDITSTQPRSTSSTVTFTGGKVTGGGIYNSNRSPVVAATPEDNYEIDYFYGGPESASSKVYDYASSGSSSFSVFLNGQDHYFRCGFKKKQRTLTLVANPSAGGSVSGGGKFNVKEARAITATPASGYSFTGWTVSSGDATIANASSASTTATLQSSNSTLQANFKQSAITYVTVNVSYESSYGNFSGPLNVHSSEMQGNGYISGSSGTVKVGKGTTVTIDIQGDLYLDGEYKPNAGIDNIYARQNGSIVASSFSSYSITFTANTDTSVSIKCYSGD